MPAKEHGSSASCRLSAAWCCVTAFAPATSDDSCSLRLRGPKMCQMCHHLGENQWMASWPPSWISPKWKSNGRTISGISVSIDVTIQLAR